MSTNLRKVLATYNDSLGWVDECDPDVATAARSELSALEAENKRLREALQGLMRHEVYTYEGKLEASMHVAVDDVERALKALEEKT